MKIDVKISQFLKQNPTAWCKKEYGFTDDGLPVVYLYHITDDNVNRACLLGLIYARYPTRKKDRNAIRIRLLNHLNLRRSATAKEILYAYMWSDDPLTKLKDVIEAFEAIGE